MEKNEDEHCNEKEDETREQERRTNGYFILRIGEEGCGNLM